MLNESINTLSVPAYLCTLSIVATFCVHFCSMIDDSDIDSSGEAYIGISGSFISPTTDEYLS